MSVASDMCDRDEILVRPTTRGPQVTFWEGMRLRTDKGATWIVDNVRDEMIGLGTEIGFTTWHRDDLVQCIAEGEITIEPMVGMRIECAVKGSGSISRVENGTVRLSRGESYFLYPQGVFDLRARTGTWTILPPEQVAKEHAPTADRGALCSDDCHTDCTVAAIELSDQRDAAIRRAESAEAEAHDQRGRAEKAEAECHELRTALADEKQGREWAEGDAKTEAKRAEALSVAYGKLCGRFERLNAERISLGDKLRLAEASELLYGNTLEALCCLVDNNEDDARCILRSSNERAQGAGINQKYASVYWVHVSDAIRSLRATISRLDAPTDHDDRALASALEYINHLETAILSGASDVDRAVDCIRHGARGLSNTALLGECWDRMMAEVRGDR